MPKPTTRQRWAEGGSTASKSRFMSGGFELWAQCRKWKFYFYKLIKKCKMSYRIVSSINVPYGFIHTVVSFCGKYLADLKPWKWGWGDPHFTMTPCTGSWWNGTPPTPAVGWRPVPDCRIRPWRNTEYCTLRSPVSAQEALFSRISTVYNSNWLTQISVK